MGKSEIIYKESSNRRGLEDSRDNESLMMVKTRKQLDMLEEGLRKNLYNLKEAIECYGRYPDAEEHAQEALGSYDYIEKFCDGLVTTLKSLLPENSKNKRK